MAFVVKADLLKYIESSQLDIASQADDDIIANVILTAEEEAKGYMRHRYDVGVIFAKSGTARDNKLLQVVIDIALYHLFTTVVPRNIPEIRSIRYDGNDPRQQGGAIGWLKMVQKGTIQMDLEVKTDSAGLEEGHRVLYGNKTTSF